MAEKRLDAHIWCARCRRHWLVGNCTPHETMRAGYLTPRIDLTCPHCGHVLGDDRIDR